MTPVDEADLRRMEQYLDTAERGEGGINVAEAVNSLNDSLQCIDATLGRIADVLEKRLHILGVE